MNFMDGRRAASEDVTILFLILPETFSRAFLYSSYCKVSTWRKQQQTRK
jgi:hypothetical protein